MALHRGCPCGLTEKVALFFVFQSLPSTRLSSLFASLVISDLVYSCRPDAQNKICATLGISHCTPGTGAVATIT